MEISHLVSIFEADYGNFDRGADRVDSRFNQLASKSDKTANEVTGSFSRMSQGATSLGLNLQATGSSLMGLGNQISDYISKPLQSLGALGLGFNAAKEQALVSFKVMLKSAADAKKLFSDLMQFANTTPFESPEVISAGKLLKAYKFEVKDLLPILTDAGNLASGMGARLEDVARVFGRLKSGDFGEAFERLRDFGISREQLEGEGLKFDKSGQYVGSVEQALKAVRTIIQRDFGGMMDEQGKTFTGRISTLMDALNLLLGDTLEPLFNMISANMPAVIDFVNYLRDSFNQLSPIGKTIVLVLGGIGAALGPALTVLGGLTVAVGAVISAVGTVTAAGGLAAVVGGFVAAAAPVLAVLAGITGAVGALWLAWETNFGNIQGISREVAATVTGAWGAVTEYFTSGDGARFIPFLIESWNSLKAAVQPIVQEYSNFVAANFKSVIDYVKDNFPLIKETVLTVINTIKTVVGAQLGAIFAFWKEHGEAIKSYLKAAWDIYRTIVGGAMTHIGNVIKAVMQVITGDWRGAWETVKEIFKNAGSTLSSLVGQYLGMMKDLWDYALKYIVKLVRDHWRDVLAFIGETVVKIGKFFLDLPRYALMAIPAMIKAGMDLAKAFWEGMKQGWNAKPLALETPSLLSDTDAGGAGQKSIGSGLSAALDGLTKTKDEAGKTSSAIDKIGDSAKKSGDKAKKALDELKQQINDAAGSPIVQSFFAALSKIEGGGRFTFVGGAPGMPSPLVRQNDPRHPGEYIPKSQWFEGPAGKSSAAGLFQITLTNWRELTKILNLTDFRDVNQQLKVALYLFQQAAGRKGVNGIAELLQGNLEKAARAGTQPWAASPFSTLPGGKRRDFLSLIDKTIGSGTTFDAITKNTEAYQNLLESLTGTVQNFTAKTELQKLEIKLLGDEFKNLSPAEKDRLRDLARQADAQNLLADGIQKLQQVTDSLVPPTEFERIMKQLADPGVSAAIEAQGRSFGYAGEQLERYTQIMQNHLKVSAMQRDESKLEAPGVQRPQGTGVGISAPAAPMPLDIAVPPPVSKPWDDFWGTLRTRISGFKKEIPGLKQTLGEFLVDLPFRAGDAWQRALDGMDGTIKGFFKSIGMAFAELAKQILMEAARLAIVKGVTALIGAALGSVGGAAGKGLTDSPIPKFGGGGLQFAAGGGNVNPNQPTIVGENGWEIAVPRAPMTILNQKQVADALFRNQGGSAEKVEIHNHFHANQRTGAFDRESAQQAARRTSRYQEREMRRNK